MKAGSTQTMIDVNRGRVQGCLQMASYAKQIGEKNTLNLAVKLARHFNREVVWYKRNRHLFGDL